MILRPFGSWVVVEAIAAPDKTKGGIHLPDVAKRKSVEGIVKALGPDAAAKLGCAAGSRVFFADGVGVELVVYERSVLLMQAEDLYGVAECAPDNDPPADVGHGTYTDVLKDPAVAMAQP
jgi:chaperonin GroES